MLENFLNQLRLSSKFRSAPRAPVARAPNTLITQGRAIAIVGIGPVQIICDLQTAGAFNPPTLEVTAGTPMGKAIEMGLAMLEHRKHAYRANGISSYRPWLFLITDAENHAASFRLRFL